MNNRSLKLGCGKNAGPFPPALALAVHTRPTRNVYIGSIEDFETFSEDKLKQNLSSFRLFIHRFTIPPSLSAITESIGTSLWMQLHGYPLNGTNA